MCNCHTFEIIYFHDRSIGRRYLSFNYWSGPIPPYSMWMVFGMLGMKGERRLPVLRLSVSQLSVPSAPSHQKTCSLGVYSYKWWVAGIHGCTCHFIDPGGALFILTMEDIHRTLRRLGGFTKIKYGDWEETGMGLLKEHLAFIERSYWLSCRHEYGPLGCLLKDMHQ